MHIHNLNIHDCFYRLVKFPDEGYFIERCTIYGYTKTYITNPITHKVEKDVTIYFIKQIPYTDRTDGRGVDNQTILDRYGDGFCGIYNPKEDDGALNLDEALARLKEKLSYNSQSIK